MTFESLKAEILNRVKRLELCQAYQLAAVAMDYPSLIRAAGGMVEWTFQSGVVDEALLAEFPAEDLAAAGIYGAASILDNPEGSLYFLAGAHQVNLSGQAASRIRVLGSAVVTVAMQEAAFADIKAYKDSQVSIIAADSASAVVTAVQQAVVNAELGGLSVLHGNVTDDSALILNAGGGSYSQLTAFNNSSITYQQLGVAEFEIRKYQYATVTALENNILT